jgi:hypothetical protein
MHPTESRGMENMKGAEEPFDGMRGRHLRFRHLHHRPIAFLFLRLIEIAYVAAGAVQKEVQHLVQQVLDRDPFDGFF